MRSRDEFPDLLNSLGLSGVGVEVGTHRGDFAAHVRRHWRGQLLICVDPWGDGDYSQRAPSAGNTDMHAASDALRATGREFTFVRKTSRDAARDFALHGVRFDWVYIDAAHDYESVRDDLQAWWPLVKPGGILAGHDWVSDGWHMPGDAFTADETKTNEHMVEFGVQRAVNEFVSELNTVRCPLNLTDVETDGGWRTWWLRHQ